MSENSGTTQISPMLQALGKITSGVYVLTSATTDAAGHNGCGTLVSFVQQVAMSPYRIAIAIKKGRKIYALLNGAGKRVVINILANGDKALLKKYAAGEQEGAEAFVGVPHQQLASGQVVLSDACAYVECVVVQVVDIGADHDLFIVEPLTGGMLGEPGVKPACHVRHDGSKY